MFSGYGKLQELCGSLNRGADSMFVGRLQGV